MFENTTIYPQKSRAVIGRFLLFTNMEAEWNCATMFNFIKFCEENWFLYDTCDGNISYLKIRMPQLPWINNYYI